MGFTGDDLTGSLMICLALCCLMYKLPSEVQLAPRPQDTPVEPSTASRSPDWPLYLTACTHCCSEPQVPFQTTKSETTERAFGVNLDWQSGDHTTCERQAGHRGEWDYTSRGGGERPNRNRSRGHRVNRDRRSPSLTSSSTLPCFFTSSVWSSLPHPSKRLINVIELYCRDALIQLIV